MLLEISDLSVRFGSVVAVDAVSISVQKGSLVGLIGSNGAGKTTMLDALTGFVKAGGSAKFDGNELLGLPAHKRTAVGIARTWQSVELFDDLTVYENLRVAASASSGMKGRLTGSRRKAAPARDSMERLLNDLELGDILARYPGELSDGERKLVGLARTLTCEPKMILADEPAAGLDSDQSARLGVQLRKLVSNGLTILLVDHDMGLVLGVCDVVHVLDHGQLIASGPPSRIRSDPEVLAAYLGQSTPDESVAVEVAAQVGIGGSEQAT